MISITNPVSCLKWRAPKNSHVNMNWLKIMFEIILKRDNSLEVHFNLPDHQEVLPSIQKVNETLWRHLELPLNNFLLFPKLLAFFVLFCSIITIATKKSLSKAVAGLFPIDAWVKPGVLLSSVLNIKFYSTLPIDTEPTLPINKPCILPFSDQFLYEVVHSILFPLRIEYIDH